jgi:hypothetical protein
MVPNMTNPAPLHALIFLTNHVTESSYNWSTIGLQSGGGCKLKKKEWVPPVAQVSGSSPGRLRRKTRDLTRSSVTCWETLACPWNPQMMTRSYRTEINLCVTGKKPSVDRVTSKTGSTPSVTFSLRVSDLGLVTALSTFTPSSP